MHTFGAAVNPGILRPEAKFLKGDPKYSLRLVKKSQKILNLHTYGNMHIAYPV